MVAAAYSYKKVNTNPQKVVIYIRVSTDKQEQSGLGLEAQLKLCYEVAERHNLEVLGQFTDTASGKISPEKRPVFMEAVSLAQVTGARLMVAKLDRLSRRIYHITGYVENELFGKLTPNLLVADSPNMSQLELHVRAMIAQEERRLISERTKAALAECKKNGADLGAEGRKVSHKKARDKTKEAMTLAISLREEGLSYRAISDRLNNEGFTTSKGGSWYAANVRLRLKSLGH